MFTNRYSPCVFAVGAALVLLTAGLTGCSHAEETKRKITGFTTPPRIAPGDTGGAVAVSGPSQNTNFGAPRAPGQGIPGNTSFGKP